MLLVLKTNDLLRSIEYRLGTHSRKDSFIEMTRCCIRAVYVDQMQSTDSLLTKCLLIISLYTMLAKLFIYQQYLTGVDIFSTKVQ
jgi:aarF domain-containing kinase